MFMTVLKIRLVLAAFVVANPYKALDEQMSERQWIYYDIIDI